MCLSQNKETEKYLRSFGVRKVKNLGNLKFSKSKFTSSNKLNKNILKMFQYKKIWCASSTHDGRNFLQQNTY